MTIMHTVLRYLERARAARERARTERLISELSPEVRKDIGWPGAYPGRFVNCDGPTRR